MEPYPGLQVANMGISTSVEGKLAVLTDTAGKGQYVHFFTISTYSTSCSVSAATEELSYLQYQTPN